MSDIFALARLSRKMANAAERFHVKKNLSVDEYLKMQAGFKAELERISGRTLDELVLESFDLELELEPLDGDMELIGCDDGALDELCTDDGALDELLADCGAQELEAGLSRAAAPKTRRKGRKRAEAIPALAGR